MAKELPYFKFEPGAWDNGNIQMCSRESKGLFIDLCSIYWSRLGELPYALALQKLCNGNNDALQELQKQDIFGVIDGNIVIEFLDEQLSEFQETSKKRTKAANKRWSDANALQLQSKSNAIREDKIREDKKDVYTHGKGKFSITIKKVYTGDKIHKIHDLDKYFQHTGQSLALHEAGWFWFDEFVQANSGKVFNDPDHLYNTFRQFCISYKPPAKEANPYSEAEYNKTLWTTEAWEKEYGWKLTGPRKDENFRKHFGYGELPDSKTVGGNGNH